MQTATPDLLDDVQPLVAMALAAEARLRPHLIGLPAPGGDAGDVPRLNAVTLILGRLISIRKSLRALRDGNSSAPPRALPPAPHRPVELNNADWNEVTVDSIAAGLADASAMLDQLSAAGTPAAAGDQLLPKTDQPAAMPAQRDSASTPLMFPLVAPVKSQANAKKLARALGRLAAAARRVLPGPIPRSPFGLDDLHPRSGPFKLSPALLGNLSLSAAKIDTS